MYICSFVVGCVNCDGKKASWLREVKLKGTDRLQMVPVSREHSGSALKIFQHYKHPLCVIGWGGGHNNL